MKSLITVAACACLFARVALSATFSASSFGLTAPFIDPAVAQAKLQSAETAMKTARGTKKVAVATIVYLVNLCTQEGRTGGAVQQPPLRVAGGTVPGDVACRQQFDAIMGSSKSKAAALFCDEAWDLLEPFFLSAIHLRQLTPSEIVVVDTYGKWCRVRRPDQVFVSIVSKLLPFYDKNFMKNVVRVEDLDPIIQVTTRQAREFLSAFPNVPNARLACAMVDVFITSKMPDVVQHLRFVPTVKRKASESKITSILCRKVLKPIILHWRHGDGGDDDSARTLHLWDVEPLFRLYSASCKRDAPSEFAIAASRRDYALALKKLKAVPDEHRVVLLQYDTLPVELHYRQAFTLFLWHPSETQRIRSQFIQTALLAIKLHDTAPARALHIVTAAIVLHPDVLSCDEVTEGIRAKFEDEGRWLIRDLVLEWRTALLNANPDTKSIDSSTSFHDSVIPPGYVRAFGPDITDVDYELLTVLRLPQADLHPTYALHVVAQRLDPLARNRASLIPFDWFDDFLAMALALTLRPELHHLCAQAPVWMARMIKWIIEVADELQLGENWWLELPDAHRQRKSTLTGPKIRRILSDMNAVCKEHSDDVRCAYLLLVAQKLTGRPLSKAGAVRDGIPATYVAMRRLVDFLTLDLNDPAYLDRLRGFAPMFSYEYDYYRVRAMVDEGRPVTPRLVSESWNVAGRLNSFPTALRMFVDVFKRLLDTPFAMFLDLTSLTFNMLGFLRNFITFRQHRPELWASTRAMADIWEDLIQHPAFEGSKLLQEVRDLRDTFPDMAPLPPSTQPVICSIRAPALPVQHWQADEHLACDESTGVTKQVKRRSRMDQEDADEETKLSSPIKPVARSLLDLRVFVRKAGDDDGALSEFARSHPDLRSLEGLLSMDVTMLRGSTAKLYRIRDGDTRVLYCFNPEERGELRLLDISGRDGRTYSLSRIRNAETYAVGDRDQFELVEYAD